MPQPCTRESRRCEFWKGSDYLRPDCCTTHLKELLFFTEDLLTHHGIFHWLDYGSLLGAVRGQAFIPWDSDVDWGFLASDLERVRALEGEIERAGFWLDTRDPKVWRVNYSGVNLQHADLYPWRLESDEFTADAVTKNQFFPARFLEQPERVQLYGRTFPAPSPVHDFLKSCRYGADYLTPRRRVFAAHTSEAAGEIKDAIGSVRKHREQIRQFQRNLVELHDTLQDSPLADRYWIFGGLLVGWAREGRILPHDSRDADLGFLREDRENFLASAPLLMAAGFRPLYRYSNNQGEPLEYSFAKDGARFDFFEHERQNGFLRYSVFGSGRAGGPGVELIRQIPAQPLAPMQFLGRTWQKPADHAAYLESIYGDWMEPDPTYTCLRDDPTIVETCSWAGSCNWPAEGIVRVER